MSVKTFFRNLTRLLWVVSITDQALVLAWLAQEKLTAGKGGNEAGVENEAMSGNVATVESLLYLSALGIFA